MNHPHQSSICYRDAASSIYPNRLGTTVAEQQKALYCCQQLAPINTEVYRLEPGNTDLYGT
jgi:hypothetical protein